jgi:hypothetical protein
MDAPTPSEAQATGTIPVSVSAAAGRTAREDPGQRPSWIDEARTALEGPARYLAYEEDERRIVVPVGQEWTRIGRSLAADIRFDDATVSRRHALVVCQADGVRVVDDRSLNGVYVNGDRVEWSALSDGDRISIGRHTLWYLDTSAVRAAPPPTPLSARE